MNKKVAVIGVAAGLVLGGAGAAFAYFTSNGTGSGSGTTGNATAVTIAQTGSVTGLLPGGPSETINYTVTNPGAGSQYVGQVTATVAAVTSGSLSSEACTTSMYAITQGAAINTDIAAGGTATGTATIKMIDDSNNQDNCEAANSGGALTLAFTSN